MLRWRLLLGVLFVAALVGLFWADDVLESRHGYPAGLLLLPLALLLTIGATQEFLLLVRVREPLVNGPALYLGNFAIVGAAWFGTWKGRMNPEGDCTLAALAASIIALFVVEILRYDKDSSRRVVERIGLGVLGLVYVGLLMSFVVRLRLPPQQSFALVMMLVVVKLGDIGAYTVGRLIGRNKLAPKLSPGKTVEGLVGGLLFSAAGACAMMPLAGYISTNPPKFAAGFAGVWGSLLIFGVVVSLAGVAGDLIESLFKRDAGRKDSSTWMPGFGGILDLIDSPLLAAPVAWAFWHCGFLTA